MSGDETGITSDAAIAGMSGDSALEDLCARPVALLRPLRQTAPFIFASPHSGRLYPASFARQSRLDPDTLRKSEDAFVDELFAPVTELGAPLLAARFPRAFVDVNRAPGEIDPSMFDAPLASSIGPRSPRVAAGLGVIPRIVRDGVEIYGARLPVREAVFRLENFYRPYHAALAKLVAEARAEFGLAIVIDCHSMPPPSRGTDIVIGDCHGEAAAAELIVEAQRTLAELGFSVARNAPMRAATPPISTESRKPASMRFRSRSAARSISIRGGWRKPRDLAIARTGSAASPGGSSPGRGWAWRAGRPRPSDPSDKKKAAP